MWRVSDIAAETTKKTRGGQVRRGRTQLITRRRPCGLPRRLKAKQEQCKTNKNILTLALPDTDNDDIIFAEAHAILYDSGVCGEGRPDPL